MTNEITIDPNDIGPANLQHYQEVYHNLTKRPEKQVTLRSERHRIVMEHLIGLNREIEHTAHTMEVVSASTLVTQRLSDQTYEQWTAFEKFRVHGPNIPHVTTHVEITYNLLIRLPHTNTPGPYKITIGLRNELYDLKQHQNSEDEISDFDLLMMSQIATARWELEFTDVSVARTFSRAISGWYDGVPTHSIPLAERISKHAKGFVTAGIRTVSAIIVAVTVFGFDVWKVDQLKSEKIAIFIVALYGIHFITSPLIKRLNRKISCIRSASSLSFTVKDRDLLADEEDRRGKLVRWIWLNIMVPQAPASVLLAFKNLYNWVQ